MRNSVELLTLSACCLLPLTKIYAETNKNTSTRKNVLFIAVDDLRPELNCFGATHMITPNIDNLVGDGVAFRRAYCNIAVSGASRASLLTGTRPTRDRFLTAHLRADREKPDKIAINDYFKSIGYTTEARGKVFHDADDHINGWSVYHKSRPSAYYAIESNGRSVDGSRSGMPYERADVSDETYPDGERTLDALLDLERLSKSDKPFFYALGYVRPHLPFNVPERYWQLYDDTSIELPDNYVLKDGHNIPERVIHKFGELRNYASIPKTGRVSDTQAKMLIRGYRASVSFIDAQIGLVVSKLKELGLYENTMIVIWGDHGWNLGDHGLWCKHSVLETSINAPLIIYDPGSKLKGSISDEVVEYVDVFPTICDITGVDKPEQLEGESLYPLLNNSSAKSKGYAICRWGQGYTIVTDDKLSYTEWWDAEDNVEERMLFDHNTDPDENYNVVGNTEYRDRVSSLSSELKRRRGAEFDKYALK